MVDHGGPGPRSPSVPTAAMDGPTAHAAAPHQNRRSPPAAESSSRSRPWGQHETRPGDDKSPTSVRRWNPMPETTSNRGFRDGVKESVLQRRAKAFAEAHRVGWRQLGTERDVRQGRLLSSYRVSSICGRPPLDTNISAAVSSPSRCSSPLMRLVGGLCRVSTVVTRSV